MTVFCTYIHRERGTGQVFYVGKGSGGRPWDFDGRSRFWKRVAEERGVDVKVLATRPTEAEAFEHEAFLIQCFLDLGAPLVNRAIRGGGGAYGYRFTPEQRAKVSEAKKGHPVSAEVRRRISTTQKGRKQTAEHTEKIRKAVTAHHQRRRYNANTLRGVTSDLPVKP